MGVIRDFMDKYPWLKLSVPIGYVAIGAAAFALLFCR